MRQRFTQSLPLLGTLCLLIIGSAVLFKLTPAGATIAITAEAETLPIDAETIAENIEITSEDAETGIIEDSTESANIITDTDSVNRVSEPDRVKSQIVSNIETVQSDSFLQTNWLVVLGAVIAVSVVITMAVLSNRRSHANR